MMKWGLKLMTTGVKSKRDFERADTMRRGGGGGHLGGLPPLITMLKPRRLLVAALLWVVNCVRQN
jgi:hypothetical protein